MCVHAGIACKKTAHKIFGEKSDYYQTLYALRLLYEVIQTLQWGAFQDWCLQEAKDVQSLEYIINVLQKTYDTVCSRNHQYAVLAAVNFEEVLKSADGSLSHIHALLREFCNANKDKPTFTYWNIFLDMIKDTFSGLYTLKEKVSGMTTLQRLVICCHTL